VVSKEEAVQLRISVRLRHIENRNISKEMGLCRVTPIIELQSNPVITTSLYISPRLKRQILCGTN
jgi:hypothetical protein